MFAEAIAVFRRNPDFRRLFIAALISMLGDWFSFVAVASLLTEITHRASTAAFAYAAMVLPIFLATPIAGNLADRFDRRRIMLLADVLRVPLALSLIGAAYWHSVPLAIAATIALGVGAAFSDPVASAALPNLVADEDLTTAQAMFAGSWGAILIVGAGLGGLTAAYLGRTAAFAIDAASFAISAAVLWRIRRPMQTFATTTAARAATSTAPPPPLWPHLRQSPITLRLLLAKVGVSSANGTVGLLPGLIVARLAGGDRALGLVLAARGLGAMCGPPLARRLAGRTPSVRGILWVCGISTMTYAAAYALVPSVPWLIGIVALVAVAHLGGGAQWTLSSYGLQSRTPDELRGRVMSLDYGLATLAIGSSAVVAGVIADATSVATAMHALSAVAALYGIAWAVAVWPWARASSSDT